MPNPIKYTTGTETLALKKGNFYIGTGDVGKGPSDVTGFYQGPSPSEGGYVIYMNRDGAPGNLSYHSAANDAELISFTNSLAGQSYTTAQQCFDYYYGQTDKVLVNQDYPANYPYIVMDGLVLNLDAGITQSYPGSGTVWTDVNGLGPKNNGTLTNGPTFSTDGGGSIVFDGTNDYVLLNTTITLNYNKTFIFWLNLNGSTGTGYHLINKNQTSNNYRNRAWITSNELVIHWGEGIGDVINFTLSENIFNKNKMIGFTTDSSNIYLIEDGVKSQQTSVSFPDGDRIYQALGLQSPGSIFTYYKGNINVFQHYNRALSADEVLQNYNATKGRFGL